MVLFKRFIFAVMCLFTGSVLADVPPSSVAEINNLTETTDYTYTSGIPPSINVKNSVDKTMPAGSALDFIKAKQRLTFTNNGDLTAQDGHVYHMSSEGNPTAMAGTTINNNGKMLINDGSQGYAIYGDPMENQLMTTTINNNGEIDRIFLYQTAGSTINNAVSGKINGSVLLGTDSTIINYGQFLHRENDPNPSFTGWADKGSLIWMDKNGVIKNGFLENLVPSSDGRKILDVELTPDATITTDNIYFKQSGTLYNAGHIENKLIQADDHIDNNDEKGVKIYLMNNPYYETDKKSSNRLKTHLKYYEDELHDSDVDDHASIKTGSMKLGDKATFRADQGSVVEVVSKRGTDDIGDGTLEVGKNSTIEIGANYYWLSDMYKDTAGNTYNWEREIKVEPEIAKPVQVETTIEGTDQKVTETKYVAEKGEPEDRSLNPIPQTTIATIEKIKAGDNSQIILKDTNLTGKSISMEENGLLDIDGGTINLSEETQSISLKKGANIDIHGYVQDKVVYSDDSIKLERDPKDPANFVLQEYKKSVIPMTGKSSKIDVSGDVILEDNSLVQLSGEQERDEDDNPVTANATLDVSGDFKLGNDSTITGTSSDVTDYLSAKSLSFGDHGTYMGGSIAGRLTEDLRFKNFGTFVNGVSFTAGGDAIFDDDGTFTVSSTFSSKTLNMNDRATIYVNGVLDTRTYVGSDSKIYLEDSGVKGGSFGITNGLFKKDDRTNVNVYSMAGNYNEDSDIKKIYNENYILNGVKVDNIDIQTGGLRLGTKKSIESGTTGEETADIHGVITLNDDTWVRFTGHNVDIYDPIKKVKGAKNTLIWLDLDEHETLDMRNAFDSDTVMIGGGTLNASHKVTASKIYLDNAGGLRVYNNDLIHADVSEYEGSTSNTTLFIAPTSGEMDSFGMVNLDRLIVENGKFNAKHPLFVRGNNDGKPEGIWLKDNTVLNVEAPVETSQVIRYSSGVGKYETSLPVTELTQNTEVDVSGGKLVVDRAMDVDRLRVNAGVFEFKNIATETSSSSDKNAVIAEDVVVHKGGSFLASGSNSDASGKVIINDGHGNLTIGSGGAIGVSYDSVELNPIGHMNLNANLWMDSDSIIDLRMADGKNDILSITGSAILGSNILARIRGLEENTDYQLMNANGGLEVDPNSFKTSFLWHDTKFETKAGKELWLNVGKINTLKDELSENNVNKNIQTIGGVISDLWDGTQGVMDSIFFAQDLKTAVKNISEYIPEGFVNAPQAALRSSLSYQNIIISTMDDTRQLIRHDTSRTRVTPEAYRRPVYYSHGRSGGDSVVYKPYVRNAYARNRRMVDYSIPNGQSTGVIRTRSGYRTDKGGIWAKPFYLTMKQDDNKGNHGYDYDSYGLVLGADRQIGNFHWGLSGIYAMGDYEQTNSVVESDVKTYGLSIYGGYRAHKSPLFIDVYASYLKNNHDTKHKIETAHSTLKAEYDIKSLGVGMGIGYDIALGSQVFITPKIGVNWTRLSTDKIKEKGNAPLIMTIENPDIDSLQLPIELRFTVPIITRNFELLPEFHVRYIREFGDTDYKSKVKIQGVEEKVKLNSVETSENLFTIGGSLAYTQGANEFSGKYDLDCGDNLSGHNFSLSYKHLF